MGITDFFGDSRRNVVQVVGATDKCVSKEKQRELEVAHLRPASLPPYVGDAPLSEIVKRLSVRLVFSNMEDVGRFKKYFKMYSYIEQSVSDLRILLALFDALEDRRIVYDDDSKKLRCTQCGNSEGISEMDTCQ